MIDCSGTSYQGAGPACTLFSFGSPQTSLSQESSYDVAPTQVPSFAHKGGLTSGSEPCGVRMVAVGVGFAGSQPACLSLSQLACNQRVDSS
jgi:hypothetical protein